MLTLSCVDLEQPGGLNELVAHATPRDRADSQRFHRPRRQLQALAGRALLRREIASLPGGPFVLEASGQTQPKLVAADPQRHVAVSLAHSASLVVAAVADAAAVGVDVEQVRPARRWAAIAASVFGPGEQARCAREGVAAFYRIWTLREALAKACGVGFRMVVDAAERFGDAPPAGAWRQDVEGASWVFATRTLAGGYALALALREPRESADEAAARLAALTV